MHQLTFYNQKSVLKYYNNLYGLHYGNVYIAIMLLYHNMGRLKLTIPM
jgi:hypothetical protein